MFSQLPIRSIVYAYMNGEIFKLFGVVILIFNLLMTAPFVLGIILRRDAMSSEQALQGSLVFFGFILLSTLIAVGLIRLHRWAAVAASSIGLIWALALGAALGGVAGRFWFNLLIGTPIIAGMLLPLYITMKHWSLLKPIGDPVLRPFYHALRSLDRFHLE